MTMTQAVMAHPFLARTRTYSVGSCDDLPIFGALAQMLLMLALDIALTRAVHGLPLSSLTLIPRMFNAGSQRLISPLSSI